jgi:hypothetical protein
MSGSFIAIEGLKPMAGFVSSESALLKTTSLWLSAEQLAAPSSDLMKGGASDGVLLPNPGSELRAAPPTAISW